MKLLAAHVGRIDASVRPGRCGARVRVSRVSAQTNLSVELRQAEREAPSRRDDGSAATYGQLIDGAAIIERGSRRELDLAQPAL